MPTLNVNKEQIVENFGKAAVKYDDNAALQKRIGKKLWADMEAHLAPPISVSQFSLLDLGCGSGYFLEIFRQQISAQLVAVDLAPAMVNFAKERMVGKQEALFINADAESIPLRSQSINAVFSNFALQWCGGIEKAVQECWRILKPGGCFGFSIPVSGTLDELRQSWECVDSHAHVNSFFSPTEVEACLRHILDRNNYAYESCVTGFYSYSEVNYYRSLKDALKELKNIGANTVKENRALGLTGRKRFLQLVETYEKFRDENGLPVSYQVLNVVLVKPN